MANIVQGTRVAPWIGIGTSGHWKSSAEALHDSGLDFTVRQEQLYWNREDRYDPMIVYSEVAPMFGNIRNDDDRLLGCVTPQYKIVQNTDAFSMLDPFLGNGEITHAGMTEDGLVFMVAEVAVRSIGGEDYIINLMATNSFNTKYPCQIIMTPVRIICQNMYRKLVNDKVFLAKHTTSANERLQLIANSQTVERKILAFGSVVETAQGKSMTRQRLEMLIAMLFPYPKENSPRELTFKAKTDEQRKNFMDRYFDAPDNRMHQDTAFGFVNAYYDWLSHRGPSRESGQSWDDRRLSGIVSGLDVDNAVLREALK